MRGGPILAVINTPLRRRTRLLLVGAQRVFRSPGRPEFEIRKLDRISRNVP